MDSSKTLEAGLILIFTLSVFFTYALTKGEFKTRIEKAASVAIVGMYFISAIDKFLTDSDVNRLMIKWKDIGVSKILIRFIVYFGGFWELLSSVALIASIFTKEKELLGFSVSKIRLYSIFSLVLFTLMATLMIYVYPFRPLPIISNINSIGGLLALV
tara:strand:+ start:90 stop:563 length:474 start_codon:yes stop_codon:yes gene_type:complete